MKGYRTFSAIVGSWISGGPELDEVDIAAITLGLRRARTQAEAAGWRSVWLVTYTNRDLDPHGTVARAIGAATARSLRAGHATPLGGVTLRHASAQTARHRGVRESILAVHPTRSVLDQLDDLIVEHSLVVVPGPGDHSRRWAETWGAENLVPDGERYESPQIADLVVRERVDEIANSAFGRLTYPDDLDRVRAIFQQLRNDGHRLDRRAIRAFLITQTNVGTANAEKIARAATARRS